VTTTLHHVYEFTTREGRAVRFEERGGPGTVLEGDIVTVHYTADHPERATAEAPARGKLAGDVVFCALVFFGDVHRLLHRVHGRGSTRRPRRPTTS
jgi:hypothetical protein